MKKQKRDLGDLMKLQQHLEKGVLGHKEFDFGI